MVFFIVVLASFFCGLFFVGFLNYMMKRRILKEAEAEGREYISQAQQNSDDMMSDLQRQIEEERLVHLENLENELQPTIEKDEEKKTALSDRETQLKEYILEKERIAQGQQSQVDHYENQVKGQQERLHRFKKKFSRLHSHYQKELEKKFSFCVDEIKEELKELIVEEERLACQKDLQFQEELAQQNMERNARSILHIALNRFARAYCPERGNNYIHLIDEETKDRIFESQRAHLRQVEELCGVDLIYKPDMNSLFISGFDPVRREWACICLKKLLVKKNIDETFIRKMSHGVKRELFRKIKRNGKKLGKELCLTGLHPKIIYMMGALRYRYSFAQNQYFHCSEVGFLCGLLATELGLPISEARRIGMLHDIGKAMDHSLDGGHAVIGADFIKNHGESAAVVHAVRAHHYDEEPSTDLAFLVIAADALSGARPGARRSTTDSYVQKMGQLQKIGSSFEHTKDTCIMSAGREVRIQVDSKKVSDRDILDLSKKIVRKIEEECNYPGFIKVTVVRQTQTVEYAK